MAIFMRNAKYLIGAIMLTLFCFILTACQLADSVCRVFKIGETSQTAVIGCWKMVDNNLSEDEQTGTFYYIFNENGTWYVADCDGEVVHTSNYDIQENLINSEDIKMTISWESESLILSDTEEPYGSFKFIKEEIELTFPEG